MGVAPEKVCSHIRRCPKAPVKEVTIGEEETQEVTKQPIRLDLLNGKLCGMCELGVAIVQNYLAAQQSQQAIQASLLKWCSELPIPTSSLCAMTVITTLPTIMRATAGCSSVTNQWSSGDSRVTQSSAAGRSSSLSRPMFSE